MDQGCSAPCDIDPKSETDTAKDEVKRGKNDLGDQVHTAKVGDGRHLIEGQISMKHTTNVFKYKVVTIASRIDNRTHKLENDVRCTP